MITRSTEWDAARASLTRKIRAALEANTKLLHIPEPAFEALLDCEVTSYIQWLNTTDCSYLYDEATTTVEWHLKEQNACLERAGVKTRWKEIDLECTKLKVPNEWSIYEDMFAKTFAASVDWQHPNSPAAQKVGACAADQYVAELNRLGCAPMNVEAPTREAMLSKDCIHKNRPILDRRMKAVLHDCRAAVGRNQPPG